MHDQDKQKEVRKRKMKERGQTKRLVVSGCLLIVLLLIGGAIEATVILMHSVTSVSVTVDAKTSVTLNLNKYGETVNWTAESKELSGMLEKHGVKDKKWEEAISVIAEYISVNEIGNCGAILLSVDPRSEDEASPKREEISGCLRENLCGRGENIVIISQIVPDKSELRDEAKANGISEGKAVLLNSVIQKYEEFSSADLSPCSVSELVWLADYKNLGLGGFIRDGYNESGYGINTSQAEQKARRVSGVGENVAYELQTAICCENGQIFYQIKLSGESGYCECKMSVISGEVAECKWVRESNLPGR